MVILNLFTSCGSAHHTTEAKVDLSTLIEHSQVFNNHFTGFSLYDPVIHKTLYAYNDQKYFTPASNTKILTFYTALSSILTKEYLSSPMLYKMKRWAMVGPGMIIVIITRLKNLPCQCMAI